MAKARILYKTDHRHSFASRDFIGVFTSKVAFEKVTSRIIASEIAKDDDVPYEEKLTQTHWQTGFFLEKKQTYGLPEFELVFEDLEVNKLI